MKKCPSDHAFISRFMFAVIREKKTNPPPVTDGAQMNSFSFRFSRGDKVKRSSRKSRANTLASGKQQVQPGHRRLPLSADGNKGKSGFHNKWNVITVTAVLK